MLPFGPHGYACCHHVSSNHAHVHVHVHVHARDHAHDPDRARAPRVRCHKREFISNK